MNTVFYLWGMTPGRPEYQRLYTAGLVAGQAMVADLFHPDHESEKRLVLDWLSWSKNIESGLPTRGGLRISCRAAIDMGERLDHCGRIVLVGTAPGRELAGAIMRWRRAGITVAWEFFPHTGLPCDARLIDAIILRGYESGGISLDQSLSTLNALARRQVPEGIPCLVQGIDNPELAATLRMGGACGFVLDAALLRLPEAGLSPGVLQELQQGRESGLRRIRLGHGWVDIHYLCSGGNENTRVPVGGNFSLAGDVSVIDHADLFASFQQAVNAVLTDIAEIDVPGLNTLAGSPFVIQGPMAWISNSTGFAAACSRNDIYPVFSLMGMDAAQIARLARKVTRSRTLTAYGIGIAGKQVMEPAALLALFASKPPASMVLAADQWMTRSEWQALKIPVWTHVQTRSMLEISLNDATHNFILEGCESGGRVGFLTSMVLWTTAFKTIRARGGDTRSMHLILAGGVSDAESVAFGLLLARAFDFAGKVSFQLGTPLLMSREAVKSGAIHRNYSATILKQRLARVIAGDNGVGLKVAATPAVERWCNKMAGKAPVESELYRAYERALKGDTRGLFIAGESLAYQDELRGMAEIRRRLSGWTELVTVWLANLPRFETLNFSVLRRQPGIDLAVVGIGGIFPGAATTDKFWENLADNHRRIVEIPPDYWAVSNFRETADSNTSTDPRSYAWFAGMIEGFTFDKFDCLKFHIPPRTAAATDRIHLMLLKSLDQALQSAGRNFSCPPAGTAVFVGNSMGGELVKRGVMRTHADEILAILEETDGFRQIDAVERRRIESHLKERLSQGLPQLSEDTLVGIAASTLAGRLANYLNVYGANFNVDAACASSLAALSVAAQQLRDGVCRCAVVGAVDSDLTVDTFINFCKLHALSATISRPFMEGSDGFTMGEGAGVLLLKPLDQALKDGDPVYARITGIGMSSDGNQGTMTLPSSEGQRLAIRRAFNMSGFDPASIDFIEAHGTGTEVGDRVELAVLHEIFARQRPRHIALGAVKAHVGHLKSAAGMAALVKTVMALHRHTIPPAWIEGEQRPELRQPGSPFRLPPRSEPWRRRGFMPRRAAISAFGFGGSNFHVHLEEMDENLRRITPTRLLLFSGRDHAELAVRFKNWTDAVTRAGQVDLFDPGQLRFLGGTGVCRLATVWNSTVSYTDLCAKIGQTLSGSTNEGVAYTAVARHRNTTFLFPGQGSIASAPFRQLFATMPDFSAEMNRLSRIAGQSFEGIWNGDQPPAPDILGRNDLMQAATTSLSLALFRVLGRLGIVPDAMGGHSLGCYTVLSASGMLAEHEVFGLVRTRVACCEGMRTADGGCMYALTADEEKVRALQKATPHPFYLANFNSPLQTVIAVARTHAGDVERLLNEQHIEHSRLGVTWGYHSPFVAPAGNKYRRHLERCRFQTPIFKVYSEISGGAAGPVGRAGQCPAWLTGHLSNPVCFSQMTRALYADGHRVFLEVGGRGTLSRFVRDTLGAGDYRCLTMDTTARDVVGHLHEVLATLYVDAGHPVDMGAYVQLFSAHLKPVGTGALLFHADTTDVTPSVATVSDGETAGDVESPDDPILHKVRAIIARHSGFEEKLITSDKLLRETLGIDSLKMVEIVLDLEKETGVNLAGAQVPQALTVGKLAAFIAAQSGQSVAGPAIEPVARFAVTWQPVPLPVASTEQKRFALFTWDQALADAWQSQSRGPVGVLKSGKPETIKLVMESLAAGGMDGVILCASGSRHEVDPLAAVGGAAYHLARAFFKTSAEYPGRHLAFLTAANDDDAVGAGLAGFTRSLQWEIPDVRCGHITFNTQLDATRLGEILTNEASATDDPYCAVRYLDNARQVETLEARVADAGPLIVQSSDVILVTGGGHGITAKIIEGIADARPSLIIVGSTALDGDQERARPVVATLQKLRDAGCRVEYEQCNLADVNQVASLALKLAQRTTPVTAVIHGAGVIADAAIENKSLDDFMRVLRIKAGSALVLEQVLDLSLIRFWINFASVTAHFGNHGQTDYAAANVILDAQAERLAGKGIFAKSILWSPWTVEGMAADERLQSIFKTRGISTVAPAQGVAMMRAELSDPHPAVVCYVGNPAALTPARTITCMPAWSERATIGTRVTYRSRSFDLKVNFLRDHQIKGAPVLPGAMSFELTAQCLPGDAPSVMWEQVVFNQIMRLHDGGLTLTMHWTPDGVAAATFVGGDIFRPATRGFAGKIRWGAIPAPILKIPVVAQRPRRIPATCLYGPKGKLFSGPLFQVLDNVRLGREFAVADFRHDRLPVYDVQSAPARAPVQWIDGLFQLAALYCMENNLGLYLPAGAESLWWAATHSATGNGAAHIWVDHAGQDSKEMYFNAIVRHGKQPILVLQRFAMNRIGGMESVPSKERVLLR